MYCFELRFVPRKPISSHVPYAGLCECASKMQKKGIVSRNFPEEIREIGSWGSQYALTWNMTCPAAAPLLTNKLNESDEDEIFLNKEWEHNHLP